MIQNILQIILYGVMTLHSIPLLYELALLDKAMMNIENDIVGGLIALFGVMGRMGIILGLMVLFIVTVPATILVIISLFNYKKQAKYKAEQILKIVLNIVYIVGGLLIPASSWIWIAFRGSSAYMEIFSIVVLGDMITLIGLAVTNIVFNIIILIMYKKLKKLCSK